MMNMKGGTSIPFTAEIAYLGSHNPFVCIQDLALSTDAAGSGSDRWWSN